MRVLHLLSSTGFHGAESMAAELVRAQSGAGLDCDIAVLDNGGRGDRQILQRSADVADSGTVLPCNGPIDLRTVRALRRLIRERAPDIVHSHKYKTTSHALLALVGLSPPLVTTCHNWLNDTWKLRVYAAIDRLQLRFTAANVAVSAEVAAALRAATAPERVFRIGNGVDTTRFRPLGGPEAQRRVLGYAEDGRAWVGFVGRLTPAKGVDLLLGALAGLPAASRPHLLVVGDGPERSSLVALAESCGLTGDVVFLGTRDDTPAIYPAMDALVLPSYVEAFPMVLLEAMACGVPVIATRVGDVAEIVTPGVTGVTLEPGNANALAAALTELTRCPDAWASQRAAARAAAEQRFSAVQMARAYTDVYRAALSGSRG